ncbi:hypothetical protein CsSME_00044786 [Camellia sinensis var. sinensis]
MVVSNCRHHHHHLLPPPPPHRHPPPHSLPLLVLIPQTYNP